MNEKNLNGPNFETPSPRALSTGEESTSSYDRENLVIRYLPLLKSISQKYSRIVPSNSVSNEDINSYGSVGLLKGIDTFDSKRGVPRGAYIAIKIHGAIKDGLRSIDLLPRKKRKDVNRLNTILMNYQGGGGYAPTDGELRALLGLDSQQYEDVLRARNWGSQLTQDISNSTVSNLPANMESPLEILSRKEIISSLIGTLSGREKSAVFQHIIEEKPFSEIRIPSMDNPLLNVPKNSTYHIYKTAILRMRRLGTYLEASSSS